MTSEIKIFENEEFGKVRTIEINDKIYFCGSDVAKALGYTGNPQDAIRRHCREDGCVNHAVIDKLGREQQAKFISEGNVYRLIAHSKLPKAEEFEYWVFDEVLPSIQKHGAYITPKTLEKVMLNPDTLFKIAKQLKEEHDKRILAENKVNELTLTNNALCNEENKWEGRSLLNALIRMYAACCHCNDFQYAWMDYYKQLKYKHHIDLKSRQTKSGKKDKLITYIRDNEIHDVVKLAIAICEENGLNTGKIINEVNLTAYTV